jgi:hypothetical protein
LEFRLSLAQVEVTVLVGLQWRVHDGQHAMRQKINRGGQLAQAEA